ncbi:uncharacterized protein LOC143914049 [Arctopsyche grandis]|uniref:uncharacterized protein LOC143914049 n=1 Tax=Arctopsyche grandis TaxID=121162 RepID=UPI00406D6E1A
MLSNLDRLTTTAAAASKLLQSLSDFDIWMQVLAAVFLPRCGALDNNSYSVRRSARSLPSHSNNHLLEENTNSQRAHAWLSAREMQAIVKKESFEAEGGPVDCCPSVLEMVEPTGGKNQQDMYVELYRDGDIRQRFYELSCRTDVEDMPCRFVDRRLYNQSKCAQKYSYSYALVRDTGTEPRAHRHFPALPTGGWMLDYIRVRSGCACELTTPKRKLRHPQEHLHRTQDHHHPQERRRSQQRHKQPPA